jgi:hypothetical protein
MDERKLTHVTKSKIDDNYGANLNHVNESWCTWMKLGHFTIKDLDEFHEKDENDELDKTLQTTHIKPFKSMGFITRKDLTIYMKLNTQMKHKMKMSLMNEIKFMTSMKLNHCE